MPSAVPPSFGVCRTRCDRRTRGVSTAADRRCPISLALCAGAYWRPRLPPPRVRSGGSRVHSLSSSSRLAPAAGSLGRRATGTRPVHSPFFVMWPGVCRRPGGRVKRRSDGRSVANSKPGQRRTGRAGYRGNRGSVRRPPAQPEDRAAARLDDPGMATAAAEAGHRRTSRGARAITRRHAEVAERVGFEPTESLDSTLFKSAAINRSATSPAAEDTSVAPVRPSDRPSPVPRTSEMFGRDRRSCRRGGRAILAGASR